MNEGQTFDAVLLAGGRSTRFQAPSNITLEKPFAPLGEELLYEHQLRLLQSLTPSQLFLSARRDQAFPDYLTGVELVHDERNDTGPLEGLAQSFARSTADFLLVLSVDAVAVEALLLKKLLERATGTQGTVIHNGKFWEPLIACYPREEMLKHWNRALETGERKLQRILDEAEAAGHISRQTPDHAETRQRLNINTYDDWTEWLSRRDPEQTGVSIQRWMNEPRHYEQAADHVAVEEPLALRVNGHDVAVLMRTPGEDYALATGFLVTEGVLERPDQIIEMRHCGSSSTSGANDNVLEVVLDGEIDLTSLTRHVFTSSSCGICGKATIEAALQDLPPCPLQVPLPPENWILSLPDRLRTIQTTFEKTGGLHASTLFQPDDPSFVLMREDVGRHNALDKVIGQGLLDGIDFSKTFLLLSGRISFELVQKALIAGIPSIAAISAPSSLAVSLAQEGNLNLIGFLRDGRFNRYS